MPDSNHIIEHIQIPEFAASFSDYFMDTLSLLSLQKFRTSYFSVVISAVRYSLSKFQLPNFGAIFSLVDASLSFYFRYCGLSPCTVDVDDQTYVHFWAVSNPKPDKPNLVIIHGYGGDSKWQFLNQIGPLSKCFNLYAPDLVFFGKSHSKTSDRSDIFQSYCVAAGLKKLGVLRYSAYGISYGGYVVYRMAQLHPEAVEKIVIASCGITCSKEMLVKQLSKVDKDFKEVLLPQTPEDLRLLVNLSFGRGDPFKWLPDAFIQMLINVNPSSPSFSSLHV